MLGHLKREDLHCLLRISDLFILNSAYEGLSHVLLEAMAIGIPVIASNVGGNKELIRNTKTGLLVEHDDKEAIVRAASQILNDEKWAEEMATRGMEFMKENFGQKKMFDNYFESFGLKVAAVHFDQQGRYRPSC